jgi:hypothetical protein
MEFSKQFEPGELRSLEAEGAAGEIDRGYLPQKGQKSKRAGRLNGQLFNTPDKAATKSCD